MHELFSKLYDGVKIYNTKVVVHTGQRASRGFADMTRVHLSEPAVWKSPASSNTTPLADIAFVCYEDLSSPEEVTSPGVVAVAKGSPSGQASPKDPKQKLVV